MKSIKILCLVLALMLVAEGCKKNPTATTTPLHRAAEEGNIEQIQSLISSGADVNVGAGAWTALHEATHHGHKDITKLLIASGADVNVKDRNGQTPLSLAKDEGHEEIVELLCKHGAKD